MLKVILISIILLAIALIGFGIRLLFDRNAKLPTGSCQAVHDSNDEFTCGCGVGHCATRDSAA